MTRFPGEADRDSSRELWVQTIKGAMESGRPVTTVPARSARDRHKAQLQNYLLSKKSYGGFGPNYDRINWTR